MNELYQQLLARIEGNAFLVSVVGLGYVGLPLSIAFARSQVRVLGFDTSTERLESLERSRSYISDVTDEELVPLIESGDFSVTGSEERLAECDALIICVPTPLDRFRKPDMSYIEAACTTIGRNMKRGVLVSLESTTFPTTTEHFVLPILERESGMKAGEDFWLCYSPERVDPGNKEYRTDNTPKVIGGMDKEALALGMAVYRKAIASLHPVSSPRIAEMVKILENSYRLVNISLINELTLLAGKMGIDIWEVIEAAKTKPYGFQAFYPGPGIGGHCIPLDPFYLEYIAKNYQFDLTMIHTAGHIDNLMAHRMTIKINTALNRQKKPINGSTILFVGVSYKPDIDDARESPALKIMDEVVKKYGIVSYHDPYVAKVRTPEGHTYESIDLTDEAISKADCVVVTTNHRVIDWKRIADLANLVVDLRNAISAAGDRVYKL